ncbi:MAG TPA: hypothetical protein ENI92_04910, partial [Bacteroidetes bacterium]|nr:hypothetical protein [Bacteroidota bacterium]
MSGTWGVWRRGAGGKLTLPLLLLLPLFAASPGSARADEAALHGYLRYPDLYGDRVVFSSSGDLWTAPLAGGTAVRMTTHEGEERFAAFSPDGRWIAFSGEYYGNEDVFVIPAEGGEPRQLTFHGDADQVVGWDDRGRVLFRSRNRDMPPRSWALYAVDIEGGYPEKLPYLRASRIAFEPGGGRVALLVYDLDFHTWNRYRGGNAEQIWVGDPSVPEFERPLDFPGNQSFPMWNEDGRIFFVCDSLGRENLWSMLPDGSGLVRHTTFDEDDVRWPKLRDGRIIFQLGMDLATWDIASGEVRELDIRVPSDLHVARTKFIDPKPYLKSWTLSPDGRRLLAAARGEVFTLPVKAPGLIRQWTFSSGSREKVPVFLPGGGLLLLSDASGEDQLMRLDAPGGKPEMVESDPQPGWKYGFEVSPDGKSAVYADYSQRLFLVDLATGGRVEIDKGEWEFYQYAWSPDSRWLAYVRYEAVDRTALYLYDREAGTSRRICDPRFSTHSPAWDPQGRYLYCVTERNFNAYQDYDRALFLYDHRGTLALIRLAKDTPSPFLARGDAPEENTLPEAPWLAKDLKKKGSKKKKQDDENGEEEVTVRVDFEGILE